MNSLALRVLRFDFGTTLMANPVYSPSGENVMLIVGEHAMPTVVLLGTAFLTQMLLGVLLGFHNASHPGRWLDKGTTPLATASNAIPPAVAAVFVMLTLRFAVPAAARGAWLF